MKICTNCKKIFEDYEETCPECKCDLQCIEISNPKQKNIKILGLGCLGCLGCFGIICIIFILLICLLVNFSKNNDTKTSNAELIINNANMIVYNKLETNNNKQI